MPAWRTINVTQCEESNQLE